LRKNVPFIDLQIRSQIPAAVKSYSRQKLLNFTDRLHLRRSGLEKAGSAAGSVILTKGDLEL